MKKSTLLFNIFIVFQIHVFCQENVLTQVEVKTGNTSFFYHASTEKSESIVLLFHDWFGLSELSYEMADRLIAAGHDVILMDLYKGRSAKTNEEAGALMNSIDQGNVWDYIDTVMKKAKKKHDNVFIWGFSLGTVPALQTAIKNNEIIDGLVLFYGNVTQDREQLAKITFPTLMVMGAKDNANGAIDFYKNVTEAGGAVQLFIYQNARHAFANKLFNAGGNYDEKAKEASLEVALTFLKQNQ